jgi:glycosidase
MLVGEVWFPTSDVVQYTDRRMDYCFEFDLAGAIINAVGNGQVLPLKSKINQVITEYPERQYGVFLSNHDQNRVIESLSLNAEKAKLAASIMLTLPGVPYIYYGEEVGMRGVKPDEDIRRPMQWTAGANAGFTTASPWRALNSNYATSNVETLRQDPNSIWNHYRKLIEIRNNSLALRQGIYYPIDATAPEIFSFLVLNGNDGILSIHNTSASSLSATLSGTTTMLPGSYKATDLVTGGELGTVTIGATGKWENVNLGSVAGYTSRVVRLTQ